MLPEWQGKGVGRQLFELAMEGLPTPRGIAALTSSAANPVSNRLYARHGIYPLFPVLELDGPVPATSGLPRDMTGEPLGPAHLDELAEIDSVVLGVDRTPEHRWHLAQAGHRGWLLRRGEKAVGYVYLGGDGPAEDAVGPVATLDAADQEVALRLAFGELSRRGQKRCNVSVPGPNLAAQRLLWDAGFSFSGATGLLCASRPFGRFDRYLLAGDCLM